MSPLPRTARTLEQPTDSAPFSAGIATIERRRFLTGSLAAVASLATLGAIDLRTSPSAHAAGNGHILSAGQQLNPGERLTSPNGLFFFVIQKDDGNGVVYRNPIPGDNRLVPLWATRCNGHVGAFFANQGDGHLVCYGPSYEVLWASGTNGLGAGDLVMQDDGNLARYGGPSGWAWASGTDGGRSNLGSATGVLAPLLAPPANAKAEAAIAWFNRYAGSTLREGQCEKAVENAYGTTGRYGSAATHWRDRQAKGQARTPYNTAPRGALVFYNTSSDGHVAISLGDGRVVSTSVNHRIDTAPISYFQNPLGWALAPW